jgi:tetratricopeptide (TPR) repeat protein
MAPVSGTGRFTEIVMGTGETQRSISGYAILNLCHARTLDENDSVLHAWATTMILKSGSGPARTPHSAVTLEKPCSPEVRSFRETNSMRLRYIWTTCILGALLGISGCDPAALVKSKVPEPLKGLLTFEGARRAAAKPIASFDVLSPKASSVYGAGEPVIFQASVDTGKTKLPAPPAISWVLTADADKKKTPLGKGAKVSKSLEAGKYEAEVTVEAVGQKVTKKVPFRVALRMPGKIASPEDKGIPGVDIEVVKLEDETVMSRAQSDNSGTFAVEFPAEGYVIVRPKKNGLSFFPVSRIVKFSPTPAKIDFTGVESEITDMHLTQVGDPHARVAQICPGEQLSLSFQIKAKSPPKTFQVALVRRENQTEQVIRLEQERGATDAHTAASSESRTLKVRLPENVSLGSGAFQARLRLTVDDEKGSTYAVEAPDSLAMDVSDCFYRAADEASALLRAGQPEKALTRFHSAEKIARDLEDSPEVTASLNKIYINRAIALLMSAQAEKPKSGQRLATIEQAIVDLNRILRIQPRDEQGLLLKGVADYLAENYKSAVTDFNGVLLIQAGNSEAKLLRAFASLQTGLKKNISSAVDDLTEILTQDPSKVDLRKVRGTALKLVVQYQDRKDDERINTAEITIPDINSVVDLKKYILK